MAKLNMTVRNLLTVPINTPIVGGYGVSPDAQGGSKFQPLPYPFSHVALAANTGGPPGADSATLPIQVEDFRYKSVPWLPLEPSREWQMLVQAGVVSVTFAGTVTTVEELAINQSVL
jgi:hypothetical protein